MKIKNMIAIGAAGLTLLYSPFASAGGKDSGEVGRKDEALCSAKGSGSNGLERLMGALDVDIDRGMYDKKYAVIVSGSDDARYRENITLAYRTLLSNGFTPGNIFVLEAEGKKEGYYPYSITAPASKQNLKSLIESLHEKVDENTTFVMYVTGHGVRNEESEILVKGKNIAVSDLENWLSGMHPKFGILIFDQCFGGGFAKRLGKKEYVAVSASEKDEESMEGTFPNAFFGAWKNPEADKNKDGKISIQEAFDYALENDVHAESGEQSPLLVTDLDAGKIYLK